MAAARRGRLGGVVSVLDCTVAELRRSFGRVSGAKWMGKGVEKDAEGEGKRLLCSNHAGKVALYRIDERRRA